MKIFFLVLSILVAIFTIFEIYRENKIAKYLESRTSRYPFRNINYSILNKGKLYASNKKVVIVGLARNIMGSIKYLIDTIDMFCNIFTEVYLLIVENDSNDGTRKKLLEWRVNNKTENLSIDILGCDGLNLEICTYGNKRYFGSRNSERINKMADLRNIYIDYIRDNELDDYYDFMIVYDPDLMGKMYQKGVYHTFYYFDKYKDIEGIGVNGLGLSFKTFLYYYDSYAFKTADSVDLDGFGDKLDMPYKRGLIRVDSAFGGCFFYKLPLPKDCKYCTYNDAYNPGWVVCEHSGFHKYYNSLYVDLDNILFFTTNE